METFKIRCNKETYDWLITMKKNLESETGIKWSIPGTLSFIKNQDKFKKFSYGIKKGRKQSRIVFKKDESLFDEFKI